MLLVGDRLGLIDCGQVKHINLEQRLQLARLIVAIANKDKEAVVKYYVDMGTRTPAIAPCL
jgi:aarF domain-containing kinase